MNDARGTVACLLAGDINIQQRSDPRSVFANIHETLTAADILYGNLEGCLYRPGENDIPVKKFWQHSDVSMILALMSAGFDAVGCANNVMFGV
ncbi:MAG TPA: CapA family protein, partial [Verrucomicrobiae bacterium]|nr:CapA family protein [Verrucomicrobiae bacterium]